MASSQALFEAMKARDLSAVRCLLAEDPKLARARGPDGVSAVVFALYLRTADIARLLAEHAQPLDFWEAAALGDAARCEALLREDPGLAERHSPDGWTAMHYVGFFGHRALGEVLLRHRAALDPVGKNYMANTPLHSACAAGQATIVPWLLDHGAPVDARDSGGNTPLMSAAANGFVPVVEALLRAGADRRAENKDGKTALMHAREHGEDEVVKVLAGAR